MQVALPKACVLTVSSCNISTFDIRVNCVWLNRNIYVAMIIPFFGRYRNRLDSVYAGGRGCSEWYIWLYWTKGRYRSSCVSKRYFFKLWLWRIEFTKHCVYYIILWGGLSSRASYFKICILVFSSVIALETSTIHTPKVPFLHTLRPVQCDGR